MSAVQPNEIERATLSVILQHGLTDLLFDLEPEHFGSDAHRQIFTTLRELHSTGRPLDQPIVTEALAAAGTIGRAGGMAQLALLWFDEGAVAANTPTYVEALREAAARRRLAAMLASLAKRVDGDGDLAELVDAIESQVLAATRSTNVEVQATTAPDMAHGGFALLDSVKGDGLVGLSTGLVEFDQLFGGWEKGTLNVLLGAPGAGKTALWLQSALHVSQEHPVAMVQLEMTPAKMGLRALSNMARVSFGRMRRGKLDDRDYQRLADAGGKLSARKIFIAPPGIQTLEQIRAWYRRMLVDNGCTSLWIDNLKLVELERPMKDLDRFQVITRKMKLLARELQVPVIAIHHMNRGEDELKPPTMRSAYGSSSFEQDADMVLGLWRPDPLILEDVEVLPLKTRDDFGRSFLLHWIGDQQRFASKLPAPEPVIYDDDGFAARREPS